MGFDVMRERWSRQVEDGGPYRGTLEFHFSFLLDERSLLLAWGLRVFPSWDREHFFEKEGLGPEDKVNLGQLSFLGNFQVSGTLWLKDEGNGTRMVFTPELEFGFVPGSQQEFAGGMLLVRVNCPPPHPHPHPHPPEPIPPGEPLLPGEPPLIRPAGRDGDLFPYVFMRIWPEPAPEAVALNFVEYPYPVDAPPSGQFFQELARLEASGEPEAREQMELLAVAYVEGKTGEDAPYIEHPRLLTGPISTYPAIERLVREPPYESAEELVREIFLCLGMGPDEARSWLDSPEYQVLLVRIWQSYCALVINLGFDTPKRDALARLVVVDHLLRWLTAPPAMPPTREALHTLARASLVLPSALFPLPPAGASPVHSPPRREDGWILPYAIGQLQMVRRRLVGYTLGELAHVESVMAGERRQSTRRKTNSTRQASERVELDENQSTREARASTASLMEQVAQNVAASLTDFKYTDFSTQYGPPTTVTLNGGWSWQTQPGLAQLDASSFGRDVVERTLGQMTHQVAELRSSVVLRESEESTVSVFDNTAGTVGRRGIYRWLNEVYRACVVNYGNRLVLEVLLPAPAARYTARDKDLPDTEYPPVPPSALGIESFEDITPQGFAALSARYPSPELTLPPTPRRVSGIARSGLPLELALPEGYVAASLWLGYVLLPGQGSLVIEGVAGRTSVSLDVSATGVTRQDMHLEEGTVQVVLQTTGPFASPPVELEPAQLTVDIEAVPSEHSLDAWRLRTYQLIQRTYAAQLQAYTAPQDAGANQEAPQPRLSQRAVIRRELQQGTTELLFQELRERLGPSQQLPSSGGPVRGELARPRYLRFFDRAFEWSEMSYSFLGDSQRSAGERGQPTPLTASGDEGFQEFLEAAYAQLLLPVRPGEALAVLYFLESGMLWNGSAMWTAVHADNVAVALELKQLSEHPHVEHVVGEPWEVLVPTSISVLQEGTGALEELRFRGTLEVNPSEWACDTPAPTEKP